MHKLFCYRTALCFSRFPLECTELVSNSLVLLEISGRWCAETRTVCVCYFVVLSVFFHLSCQAVGSFVLNMSNHLHSSSDVSDRNECDSGQDNDVLIVINTNFFCLNTKNGKQNGCKPQEL